MMSRTFGTASLWLALTCFVTGTTATFAMPAQLATYRPSGKVTPQAAVEIAVQPNGPCFQINFTASAKCPISYRMYARVKALVAHDAKRSHTGPPNYFCRCQGGKTTIVSASTKSGHTTLLTAMGHTNHITFALLKWKVGWVIDDTYCTKPPKADLYKEIEPPICK